MLTPRAPEEEGAQGRMPPRKTWEYRKEHWQGIARIGQALCPLSPWFF